MDGIEVPSDSEALRVRHTKHSDNLGGRRLSLHLPPGICKLEMKIRKRKTKTCAAKQCLCSLDLRQFTSSCASCQGAWSPSHPYSTSLYSPPQAPAKFTINSFIQSTPSLCLTPEQVRVQKRRHNPIFSVLSSSSSSSLTISLLKS